MDNDAKCDKQFQVSNWIERLGISIKRTGEINERFNSRLSPLLKDVEAATEKEAKGPVEQLVPLATDIRKLSQDLDRISDRYEEMMSLLEL